MAESLKRKSGLPLYMQIADMLKRQIAENYYGQSGKLPNERDIAGQYDVSREVVRRALAELAGMGLLLRIRGRGNFVRQHAAGMLARNAPAVGLVYLGYTPSPFERSGSNAEILQGVSREAQAAGATVMTVCVDERREAFDDPLAAFGNHPPSKLIVAGDIYSFHAQVAEAARKIPMAIIGGPLTDVPGATIIPDNIRGMRLLVRHLHGMGHTRISFLGGPTSNAGRFERAQGYRLAMLELGLPIHPGCLALYDGGEGKNAAIESLLSSSPRPTAILCVNDGTAAEFLSRARQAGLRVPEDISVAGFDNRQELAPFLAPRLTTIAFDRMESGRLAYRVLDMLAPGKGVELRLPVALVEGDSCAPPPK